MERPLFSADFKREDMITASKATVFKIIVASHHRSKSQRFEIAERPRDAADAIEHLQVRSDAPAR